MSILVKKMLRNPKVISLLQSLDPEISIFSLDRIPLLNNGSKNDLQPISFRGEVVGFISTKASYTVINPLISYMFEEECEKKRLIQETLNRYKELSLFYQISYKLSQSESFSKVAQTSLEEVCRLVNKTQASLMVLDEKTNTFKIIASIGASSDFKTNLKPGIGIAGHVYQTGRGELINNVVKDPRFVASQVNLHSVICVPLKTEEKVVGIMNISSDQKEGYQASDLMLASAVANQTAYALENLSLQEKRIEEDRIKTHLSRYVSPQVMDSVLEKKQSNLLTTVRKEITVLFSDIRNFTHMCEKLPAEEMVEYLNIYFSHMMEVIFEKKGTLDKFLGDMILTFFNAPKDIENHEKIGLECAIAMQQAMKTVPNQWIRENFQAGIGLNSGISVVGNIGSKSHCDYTVIGDSVNIASRLQGLAKGGQILVAEPIYQKTKEFFVFKKFGDIQVKGKSHSVKVFEVLYDL